MKYTVFGRIVPTGTKKRDTIEATSTKQAINKAYDLNGKFYTMTSVFDETGLLMADQNMIYNKVGKEIVKC